MRGAAVMQPPITTVRSKNLWADGRTRSDVPAARTGDRLRTAGPPLPRAPHPAGSAGYGSSLGMYSVEPPNARHNFRALRVPMTACKAARFCGGTAAVGLTGFIAGPPFLWDIYMITHRSPIVQIFFKQMFEHLRHSGRSSDGKRRRKTKHYTRHFAPKSDTGRFLGDKDGNMHRAVDGLVYDRKKLRKNRAFGRFLSL